MHKSCTYKLEIVEYIICNCKGSTLDQLTQPFGPGRTCQRARQQNALCLPSQLREWTAEE